MQLGQKLHLWYNVPMHVLYIPPSEHYSSMIKRTKEVVSPKRVLRRPDPTPLPDKRRGPIELILIWLVYMAKTATHPTTIKVCQMLCLIVSLCYGVALLSMLNAMVALLLKILNALEFVLAPKAYPIYPMVLPDLASFL